MKGFLVSLALLVTASMQAHEVKIASFDKNEFNRLTPTFGINAELGRAWVRVEASLEDTLTMGSDGFLENTSYFRINVEGLSFDAATKSIKYGSGSEAITCASGKKAKESAMKLNTAVCNFIVKEEVTDVDDGFNVNRRVTQNLYLQVQ